MDYKETSVAGTSWVRAVGVAIDNPLGETPTLRFIEEQATNVGDRTIFQPFSTLIVNFDANDPAHVELYTKLNDLYVVTRDKRDAELAAIAAQEGTV